jgi:hypothetical protein
MPRAKRAKPISEQFREIAFTENATEQQVHSFLKKYPYVLIQLVNRSWNYFQLFSEFRMGSDFRADFLVLSADSGMWHARFIELEGPHDRVYTKERLPTRKLNWAIRQTDDWRRFANEYRQALAHELAKLVRTRNSHAQNKLMGKGVKADVELEHPQTYIEFYYHVVIGNSESFSDEERTAHARYSHSDNVMTYDRLWKTMVELETRYSTFEEQAESLSSAGRGGTRLQ